jgi:uncharacterized protein with ATP-grasp and redox domains
MEDSVRTYLECVPCFILQAIDSARRVTDQPSVHEQLLRETLTVAAGIRFDWPPPAMGQLIHRRLRELTGQSDPYQFAKQQANQFALRLYPELKQTVACSQDPFVAAVKLAIAGNVIDLGVKSSLTDEEVRTVIDQALDSPIDDRTVEELRQAVAEAPDILYLADNAGEIVLDRLLIEQMPLEKVTLAVKGAPIINDATLQDAEAAGLTDLVEVIDSGADVPGTILNQCSAAFRRRFESADLIIAKGQGNYETLSQVQMSPNQELIFLLKAKCTVISRDLECEIGELVVRKHRPGPRKNERAAACEDFDWLAEEAHS